MARITLIQVDCKQCTNQFTYMPRPGRPPSMCNDCKSSRDVWLTDVCRSSQTAVINAPKVRSGQCAVCNNHFTYTGKGKNKRACSEGCYSILYAKKPPRKSTCQHCNINFEYHGHGKLRTSCDTCKNVVVAETEEKRKQKDARTAEEIVNQLEMMLKANGSHISQHS